MPNDSRLMTNDSRLMTNDLIRGEMKLFTGIIEETGKIRRQERGSKSVVLTVQADKVLEGVKEGDSIAVNGVCLTVTEFNKQEFKADVAPETIRKSNLGRLQVGDPVNLERALQVGDRLGGHFVSGHIDGVGEIIKRTREDNAVIFTVKPPEGLLKYLVPKGSIAVDGISLTVANLKEDSFSVSVIPHTAKVTTLKDKKTGAEVNLEGDVIGKYVNRLMGFKEEKKDQSEVDLDLLQEKGFF